MTSRDLQASVIMLIDQAIAMDQDECHILMPTGVMAEKAVLVLQTNFHYEVKVINPEPKEDPTLNLTALKQKAARSATHAVKPADDGKDNSDDQADEEDEEEKGYVGFKTAAALNKERDAKKKAAHFAAEEAKAP
jgi:hypothetical protein